VFTSFAKNLELERSKNNLLTLFKFVNSVNIQKQPWQNQCQQ